MAADVDEEDDADLDDNNGSIKKTKKKESKGCLLQIRIHEQA